MARALFFIVAADVNPLRLNGRRHRPYRCWGHLLKKSSLYIYIYIKAEKEVSLPPHCLRAELPSLVATSDLLPVCLPRESPHIQGHKRSVYTDIHSIYSGEPNTILNSGTRWIQIASRVSYLLSNSCCLLSEMKCRSQRFQ